MKATIISLYPQLIAEVKPGLYPGYFTIPPAPLGDFSFLNVGDALYYVDTKNDQRQPVTVDYRTLAESIVHDFQENQLGRIIGDDETFAEPALFWVEGAFRDKATIKNLFNAEIEAADMKQNRWFAQLVKMADDAFAVSGKHSAVSLLQRAAAIRLNIQRDWSVTTDSSDKCPFCKVQLPYGAVKCQNCREIVDPVGYQRLVSNLQEMKG